MAMFMQNCKTIWKHSWHTSHTRKRLCKTVFPGLLLLPSPRERRAQGCISSACESPTTSDIRYHSQGGISNRTPRKAKINEFKQNKCKNADEFIPTATHPPWNPNVTYPNSESGQANDNQGQKLKGSSAVNPWHTCTWNMLHMRQEPFFKCWPDM
jgi:hypothetical protein